MKYPKILIVGLLIIIAGSIFYFTSKPLPTKEAPLVQVPIKQNQIPPTTQGQAVTSTSTLNPTLSDQSKPTTKSNTPQPIITNIVLSNSISKSALNITPVNPTTLFSPTTTDIYVVLTLKNATQKTQLSYIRYYKGTYIESNVSHPTKIGTKNFYFQWKLKPGQTRKVGVYTLVFYIDGKKSQTVTYSIR